VKRVDLIRHLERNGCKLRREAAINCLYQPEIAPIIVGATPSGAE
jgi:hypothetical protein